MDVYVFYEYNNGIYLSLATALQPNIAYNDLLPVWELLGGVWEGCLTP